MHPELPPDEYCRLDDAPEPMFAVIRKSPTVWPVFVTYLTMLVVGLIGQVILLGVYVVWRTMQGDKPDQVLNTLMDNIMTPEGFMFLASSTQLIIGAAAVAGASFFREPFRTSLGLGKPALSLWAYPIVIVGSLGPGCVGAAIALGLAEFLPPDDTMEKVCANLTWRSVVPFVLFIGFAPGIFEELFFRGYMQRRLLQAWSPWAAILVTALLFGILHLQPHQVIFAFVLGLWLGVIAWRTGSIWVPMLCHAVWNCGSTTLEIVMQWNEMGKEPPWIAAVIGGAMIFSCFVASVAILFAQRPPSAMPAELPLSEPVYPLSEYEVRPLDGSEYRPD